MEKEKKYQEAIRPEIRDFFIPVAWLPFRTTYCESVEQVTISRIILRQICRKAWMTAEEVRSRATCAGVYIRYNRIWMERCAFPSFSLYSYCYEKFSEIFTTQYIVMFTHVQLVMIDPIFEKISISTSKFNFSVNIKKRTMMVLAGIYRAGQPQQGFPNFAIYLSPIFSK